ncbi:MAG: hypothetical protein ACPGJV_11535 [Bacteriovoracaceae bacterium]
MKNLFLNKFSYRLQQVFIFVLHILLLYWIVYVLNNSSELSVTETFYHFTGLSFAGAGLIIGCAKWAKWHHLNQPQGE